MPSRHLPTEPKPSRGSIRFAAPEISLGHAGKTRSLWGDGNRYSLYGQPSFVVADDSSAPVICAADLLAQAEHDEIASPILITPSAARLAESVAAEVERQVKLLEQGDVARAAFRNRGGAVVTESLEEALSLPITSPTEHLCVLVENAWQYADRVRNAGGLFLGESSPEALGDYIAGPSHVMPTGGSARYASPLSVNDFLKITSLIAVDEPVMQELAGAAALIARAEGLTAHARALEMRIEGR